MPVAYLPLGCLGEKCETLSLVINIIKLIINSVYQYAPFLSHVFRVLFFPFQENLDLHVKNDAGQTFLDVLQPDSSVSECVLKHAVSVQSLSCFCRIL